MATGQKITIGRYNPEIGDILATINKEKIDLTDPITFESPSGAKYAFDMATKAYDGNLLFSQKYVLNESPDYPLRWKFMASGEGTDQVVAKIPSGIVQDIKTLKFVIALNSTEIAYTPGEDGKEIVLNLLPPPTEGVYSIHAVVKVDDTWKQAGRFDVLARSPKELKVTLVPMGSDVADKESIQKELNETWNPYGISWTVNVDKEFYLDKEGDGAPKRKTLVDAIVGDKIVPGDDWPSEYAPQQSAINRAYRDYSVAVSNYNREEMYVFVLPSAKAPLSGQVGDNPLGKQWGYLFIDDFKSEGDIRTLSHELGHGKMKLEHTFDAIPQGSTNNLMDYTSAGSGTGGTDLVRTQWEYIHNPAVFDPAQVDEDGANKEDIITQIIKEVLSNGEKGCAFVRMKIETGELGENFTFNTNTVAYLAGKYENEKIVIAKGAEISSYDITQATLSIREELKAGIRELIVYVCADGQIGYCNPKEDYKEYDPLIDAANNAAFLNKFKTDYLLCRSKSSRFLNLSFETFTEEEIDNIEHLYGGTQVITDPETGEHHTLKCNLIYTNYNSTPEQLEIAKNYVPGNGDLKIWINKTQSSYEVKSEIPQFVTSKLVLKDKQGNVVQTYSFIEFLKSANQLNPSRNDFFGEVYELFDLFSSDKGVRYLRIPESVWGCEQEGYQFFKTIFKYLPSSILLKSTLITFGQDNVANAVSIQHPILASKLRNWDNEGKEEFAFVCGVYNGIIEVLAAVPDAVKLIAGLNSTVGLDDLTLTLNKLEQFKQEDANGNVVYSGFWGFIESSYYKTVLDNCKLSEFGGEIAFVVLLVALQDYAALESSIGKPLTEVIKVLKYVDDLTGKITGAEYVLQFTSNSIGYIRNKAKTAFARVVDEQFFATAINSTGDIVELSNVPVQQVQLSNPEGELLAEIEGKTYTLISKVEVDIINLLKTVTHSIDATTIAQSRTALGAIADNLTDAQIENIIKKNYLASEKVLRPGESYLVTTEMLEEIRAQLIKVSKQVGLPTKGSTLSKIKSLLYLVEDETGFIKVDAGFRNVDGYIGREQDLITKTTAKMNDDYRLDLSSGDVLNESEGYGVIKFKNTENTDFDFAFDSPEAPPNTHSGMLGNDSRIIFEYKMKQPRDLIDGDILEIYDNNGGTPVKRYNYSENDGGWKLIR